MQNKLKKPCEIIKLDRYTGKIEPPALLLMNRSFQTLGKISRYDNWNVSLVANGLDEISFNVHKYADGSLCPVWDMLEDLKIIDAGGFGRFEISVDYTDNTETVKSVHGFSLETELAQIILREFHVNDEEAADMQITEASKDNYKDGKFVPTVFYNKDDLSHSLLHRVLADKAPHWSIGYVTPFITMDEKSQPESSSTFQRTYTVDGDSIYDFLTQTVAEESNVVFIFDTIDRKINCYSLCDCINQKNGEIMTDNEKRPVYGIGEDTLVFVSKNKLANEISISSNKDSVKNCFCVEGGDDVITDMVRAVNMNGSNYIYRFAGFQYQDMSQELQTKLEAYQKMMSDPDTINEYYGYGVMDSFFNGKLTLKISSGSEANSILSLCGGEKIKTEKVNAHSDSDFPRYWRVKSSVDPKELLPAETTTGATDATFALNTMGIYPRLCNAYDKLAYYESIMMPNTKMAEDPGSAEDQYNKIFEALDASKPDNPAVAVSSMGIYDKDSYLGVTKNVKAYAQIFLDPRFDLEIIDGSTTYSCTTQKDENDKKPATGTWEGKIKVTQRTNDKNVWPANDSDSPVLTVKINNAELEFAKQKLEKALSKGSMLDIASSASAFWNDANLTEEKRIQKIREYFDLYSLNRLDSFCSGFASCLSILTEHGFVTKGLDTNSPDRNPIYDQYKLMQEIAESIKQKRESQIAQVNDDIKKIESEQRIFRDGDATHDAHDFQKYMGKDLYLEFCKYRREDTYKNDNYVSDGLTSSECLAKAKELVAVAEKEAEKACMLQRTVSTSLNNLFALPEFDSLYEKFALFNYIRVRAGDETLKLRLIGIEFNGESASEIQVTFSEQIESVDGIADDLKSIIQQAGGMATSYPSTERQAKQGAEAEAEIESMYRDGLNAAKTMLSNNADNEVTITEHSGILCRRRDDEDSYGEKQLKITGNIMAFTDDDWKSVRMAIGETEFKDPTTGENRNAYGIVAENIVGKLLAGEKAYIGNEKGSVLITGEGIDISNGSIFLENDNYSIEIDPQNRLQGDPDEKYLFCIQDKTPSENGDNTIDDSIIMGVKADGSGYFKGNIVAKEGTIANFNIRKNKLCTGDVDFSHKTGIYFGDNGLRIGGGFTVDNNGNIISSGTLNLADGNMTYDSKKGLTVKGNIQANSGSFNGTITSTATITGGKIEGGTITGGKIEGSAITGGKIEGSIITGIELTSTEKNYLTEIQGGRITTTLIELIPPKSGNGFVPGITKLNRSRNTVTNALYLEDDETQLTKPLYITKDDGGSVTVYPKAGLLVDGRIYSRGSICPDDYDNKDPYSLGTSSYFWSAVYAKNGTINTSDRNKKHDIKGIPEIYEKLFFLLKPVSFMFDDGDRIHLGIIAQDLEDAMHALNLADTDVAAFCRDVKMKRVQDEATGECIEVPDLDEDGKEQYIYSVRYSEFIMLNTHMIQNTISQMKRLEQENDSLKRRIEKIENLLA